MHRLCIDTGVWVLPGIAVASLFVMVAPSLGVSLKRNFQKQRDTSRRFPAASLGSKPGSFSASGSFPGPSSSSKPHLTCTLILTQPRKLLHRTYHTFSHFEFLLLPDVSFFLLFPLSPTALTSADWANKRNCRASAIA